MILLLKLEFQTLALCICAMLLCPNAFQSSWCQTFFLDPGIPVVQSMGPDISPTPCSDLTDVTLADEDTNAMQINDVNRQSGPNWQCKCYHLVKVTNASGARKWPNLQPMQVPPHGGQICKRCIWCHLVVKFATNANMQMTPPGGQVWNKCIRTNYETFCQRRGSRIFSLGLESFS